MQPRSAGQGCGPGPSTALPSSPLPPRYFCFFVFHNILKMFYLWLLNSIGSKQAVILKSYYINASFLKFQVTW